jgi:hypothetical protein
VVSTRSPFLEDHPVEGNDAITVLDVGHRRRLAGQDVDVGGEEDLAAEEDADEEEDRGEQVVCQRAGEDGDDAPHQTGVGVAALVLGIDGLERVHPRDLHVGQDGDHRHLEDGGPVLFGDVLPEAKPQLAAEAGEPVVAVLRLDLEERRAEPDAELQHAHSVGARGEVVTGLVDDHEDRQPEGADRVVDDLHLCQCNWRPAQPHVA